MGRSSSPSHLNILGRTGLTVLATTLFFAPAMLWVRIPDGVEDRAARSVRIGAIAVFGAAVLLLAGDRAAGVPAVLAAVALVVYAWPVASVARSVLALAAVPVTPDPTVARSTVAKRYRASTETAEAVR